MSQSPLTKSKSGASSSLVIPKPGLTQLISPKNCCGSCNVWMDAGPKLIFCGLIVCSVIIHPRYFQGGIFCISDVEISSLAFLTSATALSRVCPTSVCVGAAMSKSSTWCRITDHGCFCQTGDSLCNKILANSWGVLHPLG